MPPSPRERISGVDTAWLRMDQPTNLMMIVGVMMFQGRVGLDAARRAIQSRFLAFSRFGQCAAQDAAGAWWETPESFDIAAHVVPARLPGRAGKRELERFVSELASTPLDPSRPLWQFHLVEDFAGGSALVARIHHCYADGIALIQVMLSMTDATAKGSLRAPKRKAAATGGRAETDFWAKLLAPVKNLAAEPAAAGQALQGMAGKGMEIASEVARLVLMGSDASTRFKGALGARKAVAWAESLPLEEVKAIGKALGCSINDVLLSMAAGALRHYLLAKGDPVEGVEIRAIVPVNLRPLEPGGTGLGNHFGLVFLDVPIAIEHPLERLYEVRRRMRALKGSYQPVIALALLSAVGYGPRALQEQVTQLLGRSASAVMTNVPGPQHALYFAGQRIEGLEFWVPQSGGIGMGISILSYDGRIQFGVITDAGLVPDPARIVRLYGEEFDKLMWLTLMTPWMETGSGDRPPNPDTSAPESEARGLSPVPRRFRNL
ncbi:MAG TPA: wax ester/triacylglycerol synthase family O-acyltransferase [Usitatibacter sp.]|nr:wax ester/triacylglycerol synthase family O-acyltransferase [Usitatibacter sp.]